MDKLREYLLRHRSDLDVDPPASDTWEYIGSNIPARPASRRRILSYAAAACLIALVGVGIWLVTRDNKAASDTVKFNRANLTKDSGKLKMEKAPRQEEKAAGNDMARSIPTPKRAGHKGHAQKREGPPDAIAAIDRSYSTLIDYQLKKLRATPLYAESDSYFSFYIRQFKEMDQDEQQVRNDIKAYGLTGELLDQLINVYQQKLNLLKNLQTEINKMNNKVREKAAPTARTEVYYLNI